MKLKKREFEDLKQRGTTVTQYLDQFTQLARYANDEYMTESKKMEKFLDGLVPSLKCQLVVHTFLDFKTLVDKAIILENEHRNMNEIRKCRMNQSVQVRNNRPRNEFQRPVAPRPAIPTPDRNKSAVPSTIGPRKQYSVLASPVMPVEQRGIMLGNAQNRGIMPPNPTTMAAVLVQLRDTITSTPTTIKERGRLTT
jgi:hypothetical protein